MYVIYFLNIINLIVEEINDFIVEMKMKINLFWIERERGRVREIYGYGGNWLMWFEIEFFFVLLSLKWKWIFKEKIKEKFLEVDLMWGEKKIRGFYLGKWMRSFWFWYVILLEFNFYW